MWPRLIWWLLVKINNLQNIARAIENWSIVTKKAGASQKALSAAAAQFGAIAKPLLDAVIEGRQSEIAISKSAVFSQAYKALTEEERGKYLAHHRKDILSVLFQFEIWNELGFKEDITVDNMKPVLLFLIGEMHFTWMRFVARWIFPAPDTHAEPGAIELVRLLRKLPHSADFDRHLTDCAALAVFYGPDEDRKLPKLSWGHVLRIRVFPPFVPPEDGVSMLKREMALRGITLH